MLGKSKRAEEETVTKPAYTDEEVPYKHRVDTPNPAIEEQEKGEEEGHVLHALCLHHCALDHEQRCQQIEFNISSKVPFAHHRCHG